MLTFLEAFHNFLFHCQFEKNLSPKTLRAYTIDLTQFGEFLAKRRPSGNVAEVDKVLLREYIQLLYDGKKAKTVKRKVATLKAFFNYLEDEEVVAQTPFYKMKIKIKEGKRLPKTMTLQEVKTLFQEVYRRKARKLNPDSPSYKTLARDVAILELLFATGVRVSELCNLKQENINLRKGFIRIIGKGDKERLIHICNGEVKEALSLYARLHKKFMEGSEFFFLNNRGTVVSEQSVRTMIRKFARHASIGKHITPHMFRHTFATLLLEEGVDIRYIQNLLGHSSIQTTQIYTQVNSKHQRKLIATKHPRRTFILEKA